VISYLVEALVVGIVVAADTAVEVTVSVVGSIVALALVVAAIVAVDIADMGLVIVALFIPLYNIARHTFNLVCICSTTQPINVSNYTGIMQSRGLFRFFETSTAY
jgi:hypothetical protein